MKNSDFANHNAKLDASMKAQGFNKVFKRGLSFFEDSNGKYVPFPVGYITGPSSSDRGGELVVYASVQGQNGWLQKQVKPHQESSLVAWALKSASSILKA